MKVFSIDLNYYINRYKYHSKKELNDLKNKRVISILTPRQLDEKIKSGDAIKLNDLNPFFMYVDKSGICPEACVQFYDDMGYLLWTYPWNGKVNLDKSLKCGFDAMAKNLKKIDVALSEQGKFVIKEDVDNYYFDGSLIKSYDFNIYNSTGKRMKFPFPINNFEYKKVIEQGDVYINKLFEKEIQK